MSPDKVTCNTNQWISGVNKHQHVLIETLINTYRKEVGRRHMSSLEDLLLSCFTSNSRIFRLSIGYMETSSLLAKGVLSIGLSLAFIMHVGVCYLNSHKRGASPCDLAVSSSDCGTNGLP